MPCLFWFHPTGHRKTKVIFLVAWLDQITPVTPGKTDWQKGHSGLGNKQEGDYSKSPGLISSREPSRNPQPSGTVKRPFLSREYLTYHIQDMKINYPSMLASTDKEALHAFICSQTAQNLPGIHLLNSQVRKRHVFAVVGLEWWIQFETLCKTNACGTPSRDIHQREEREAHTFGSQDWGSKLEVHTDCGHWDWEGTWGACKSVKEPEERSERPKSSKKRGKREDN